MKMKCKKCLNKPWKECCNNCKELEYSCYVCKNMVKVKDYIEHLEYRVPCVLLLFCPGFSGTAFVLLGSRLLWVPPLIVFFYVLLSRLLWDSFSRVLASSSTDFPYKQSHCFLIFLTGKPIISHFS